MHLFWTCARGESFNLLSTGNENKEIDAFKLNTKGHAPGQRR
jgi:hypothetical protein